MRSQRLPCVGEACFDYRLKLRRAARYTRYLADATEAMRVLARLTEVKLWTTKAQLVGTRSEMPWIVLQKATAAKYR